MKSNALWDLELTVTMIKACISASMIAKLFKDEVRKQTDTKSDIAGRLHRRGEFLQAILGMIWAAIF